MKTQTLEEKTKEDLKRTGEVKCAGSDCQKIVETENAKNYGAGPVCEKCYDRWFYIQED